MIFIGITIGAFLLDFFVKRYIEQKYARKVVHSRCRNKVLIEKYYNNGAALNLLAKKPKVMRGIHTMLMVIVGILYYFVLKTTGKPLEKTGMALLAGGGLNNLLDRYTKGHVVDYVRFNFGPKRFRKIVFNISDFFIFLGALLTVVGSGTE